MEAGKRFEDLNGALKTFWDMADKAPRTAQDFATRDALMDAADKVFLERDAAAVKELNEADLTRLNERVERVRSEIGVRGIEMSPVPQQKSTGGVTYRPLLVKNFDG